MGLCLWKGDLIVAVIRQPLDVALKKDGRGVKIEDDTKTVRSAWEEFLYSLGIGEADPKKATETSQEKQAVEPMNVMHVEIPARELVAALHDVDPKVFPDPNAIDTEKSVRLTLKSTTIEEMKGVVELSQKPITLNVQEGFMTYLKLSGVGGLIVASPWIFYQVWMFVAAGLYTHERKYVYIYGGFSLLLFLIGCVFCYFLVFPFVLRFLVGFNSEMGFWLQARFSEWIMFAIVLPVMFGLSFQLPLVMLFLDKLQILNAQVYREQWRMAVLVIAIVSMVFTPADPISMLMMMFPLIGLYFLGIFLCRGSESNVPAAA
jgi:sec-independent protein translocase protein TatC